MLLKDNFESDDKTKTNKNNSQRKYLEAKMVRLTLSAAVLGALVASSGASAFAPVSVGSKSTFVPSHNIMPAAVARSSSTALNMNLFDRFSRVAKSNLNNVLKSLEDPEKIMTQALEDMQVGLTWQQERIEIEG